MTKLPLSVFIIAKNEADRIPYTLNSVRDWVDEVIVIDSGSADETVQISQDLGARVIYHAWAGYGPQKIVGEGLCRNAWLLNLDADEEVSPALAQEIQGLFLKGEPDYSGYVLRIKALYRYQEELPVWAAGTRQIRLYHKAHAGFKDSTVHDSVMMKSGSAIRTLKAPVIHRCFRSHAHAVEKINFYTGMQAQDLLARGKKSSALKIVLTPLVAFLKCYFLRGYIMYGVDGFIQSEIYAFNRLLRQAKLRELWQDRGQDRAKEKEKANGSKPA